MTVNAGSAVGNLTVREAAGASTDPRPRGARRGEAIRELKKRDNYTNFAHVGFVYLVIIASISATIWSYGAVAAAGLSR